MACTRLAAFTTITAAITTFIITSFTTSFTITAFTTGASAKPNPWPIRFAPGSIGPDGPWNYIQFPIDSPDQMQWLVPSLLETPMVASSSACQPHQPTCPNAPSGTWKDSPMDVAQDSPPMDVGRYSSPVAAYTVDLMGLGGQMRFVSSRFSLRARNTDTVSLGPCAVAVADHVTVSFPGAAYTLDTGFLSLDGAAATFAWTAANGSASGGGRLLADAFSRAAISSPSFGLHMGSAQHNVNGSLFWGGFDQSRVISKPIVSANSPDDPFSLVDISLGTAAGATALLGAAGTVDNLLDRGASAAHSATVAAKADPGVPYIYLPGSSCDRIAAHLPVTFSPKYRLYLWNTSHKAHAALTASPHFLSFTFLASSSSSATSTIYIPLALLSLVLEPAVTGGAAAPYLPCRPYTKSSPSRPDAILGRAFLQGAFLSHNWAANKAWLAQAPGPGHENRNPKIMQPDTRLFAMATPRPWNATWAGVLAPIAADGQGRRDALSTGARAGIGAAVALVALGLVGAVWLLLRTKRTLAPTAPSDYRPCDAHVPSPETKHGQVFEAGPGLRPPELPGSSAGAAELSACGD